MTDNSLFWVQALSFDWTREHGDHKNSIRRVHKRLLMFRHVDVHLHDFMRFSEVKNTGPTVLTGGLIARYDGGGECIHPAHPPTSMRKENIISITASRGGKAARSSHHLERFLASFWSCSPCEEVSVWSLSHAGAEVLTLKWEI